MTGSRLHLSDEQLLLHASGDLHESSAEWAAEHLKVCTPCRVRLGELESALEELTQAQRSVLNQKLPSAAGPRALLKAQIGNLSVPVGRDREGANAGASRRGLLQNWHRAAIFASVALLLVLAGGRVWQRTSANAAIAFSTLTDKPDARFTPGAVIGIARSQVCEESVETPMAIPAAMKTRVLQMYGVPGSSSDAYEVDYLITPELGGATDVRNLWPEPYDHTVWNAHVKDRLENRLREMVCRGDIDLSTAQRDISTDWIAAYRKYFHTEMPDGRGSS